jgi:serine/threonine protein kinase
MTLAPGTKLGRYEIRSQLGVGGMGEVYLAEDTKLDRKVALKILPADIAAQQERMARFVREAKAAAALNHPNIAHVYEIDEVDGQHFIAMEFVDGQTLREKIHRDSTDLRKLLRYLQQVAEGLAKAHAAGIVHRDLKPDNIMIARDGYAKILDFGLAKLIEPQVPTSSGHVGLSEVATAMMPQHSMPGTVMGTVGYMSPEQAQGKINEVDHRSDIFAFGCILFEAATGQKAFTGKDVLDSLHNIVHAPTPQIKDINPVAPDEMQRIVRRCLAKDPDKRYQSIKDVAIELEELRQELMGASDIRDSARHAARIDASPSEGGHTGTQEPTVTTVSPADSISTRASSAEYIVSGIKRHKSRAVLALAALVAVAAGIGIALYRYSGREKERPPIFQNVQQTRITTSGRAGECNISPDGRSIVYKEMADDGSESLWIRQTETGNTLQIVPPAKVTIGGTTFSPDGDFVYYVFHDRTGDSSSLYRVPSIGGETKKMLADVGSGPSSVSISPDGRRAAFVRSESQGRFNLVVANLDGTGERAVATREDSEWFEEEGPAWSPDGRTIACGAGTVAGDDISYSLVGVDVESGAVKELGPKRWRNIGRAVWMPDGRAVLLLAFDEDNWQLWRVSLPGGEAAPVTNFLSGSGQTSLGVTADGRRVVTVALETFSQVWVVPASGDTNRARQLTSGAGQDGHQGLAWTPDGRIVFSSRDGGQSDIWIMGADGGNRRRLTSDANLDYSPAVSPDGRYVVFETNRPKVNNPFIWRLDIDGSNLRQLTGIGDENPHVSPDGRWVIFQSWGAPALSLWKVSIDGGEPGRLTNYLSSDPVVSPDGNRIAFIYYDEEVTPKRWRNAVIPASGGVRPVKLFDRPTFRYQHVQWTPDGRHLSYVGPPAVPSNIWLQPAEGGEPRKLTDFKTDTIYGHAWSRDGKWLVLARGAETVDVVLLTDGREK